MSGKLFAIGTGPGSHDLLTVRAVNCLRQLTILYAPAARKEGESLALSIVRPYLAEGLIIKERHFPMSHDQQAKQTVWDQVAQEIELDVMAGNQVGFISLGDVMLFSTWVTLLSRLRHKIAIEIIPGITSFAYVAAQSQFPLAMEQQSMAVISCTAAIEKIEQAILLHDSLVLMKVASNFAAIKQLLIRYDLINKAVLVSDAALAGEMLCDDLQSLNEQQKLSYFTTIIVNKKWP